MGHCLVVAIVGWGGLACRAKICLNGNDDFVGLFAAHIFNIYSTDLNTFDGFLCQLCIQRFLGFIVYTHRDCDVSGIFKNSQHLIFI